MCYLMCHTVLAVHMGQLAAPVPDVTADCRSGCGGSCPPGSLRNKRNPVDCAFPPEPAGYQLSLSARGRAALRHDGRIAHRFGVNITFWLRSPACSPKNWLICA